MDYKARIDKLQQKMETAGIDAAVLLYSRDLFYYTGTGQPATLLIPARGNPVLFAARVVEWIKSDCPSWLEVVEARGYSSAAKRLAEMNIISGKLGLETDVLPAALYLKLADTFHSFAPVNISPLILEQRMVKDSDEIESIKKAASLFTAVHRTILEQARPGLSEIELAGEILAAARKAGNEPFTFFRSWTMEPFPDGMVVSGENTSKISGFAVTITGEGLSSSKPWGASQRIIEKNDLIVVDITLVYRGYHSDLTRTYVIGKASSEQRKLYSCARQVFDRVFEHAAAGVRADELYKIAAQEAESLEMTNHFMGYGKDRAPYIGHGLGLEGDELPGINIGSTIELPPNCVFTIEPKFIVPGLGGVQVEDMVWLKENGKELLSGLPLDLFEIT